MCRCQYANRFSSHLDQSTAPCSVSRDLQMIWKARLRQILLAFIFLYVALPSLSALGQSQPFYPTPEFVAVDALNGFTTDRGWYASLKIVKMFNSFTSYEFGDPDPTLPSPISRLEFPLDQWWAGISAGWRLPLISINADLLTNFQQNTEPKFQDSDWLLQGQRLYLFFPFFWVEDWGPADQKNIFSDSDCLVNLSSLFDMSMDFNLVELIRPYGNFKVGPVVGYRDQRFYFTTHDGLQKVFPETQEVVMIDLLNPDGPGIRTGDFVTFLPDELSGDAIKFSQNYQHYYLGGKCRRSFVPRLNTVRSLPRLVEVEAQGDWAWVKGQNTDTHVLRPGRFTSEDTSGSAWHVRFNMSCVMPRILRLGLVGDFTRISTTGSHLFINEPDEGGGAFSWDRGVRVWSDQMTLAGSFELFF
jgi:hypothetical protein